MPEFGLKKMKNLLVFAWQNRDYPPSPFSRFYFDGFPNFTKFTV